MNNTDIAAVADENLNVLLSQVTFHTIFCEASDLARIGRYTDAENLLKTFIDWENSTFALDLLARISAQQGKLDQASGYWERALILSPTNLNFQESYKFITKSQRPIAGFVNLFKSIILLALAILIASLFLLRQIPLNSSDPTVPMPMYQTNDEALRTKIIERLDLLLENQRKFDEKLSVLQNPTPHSISTYPAEVISLSLYFPGTNVIQIDQYRAIIYFDDIIFDYGWHFSPSASNTLTNIGKQLEDESNRIQITIVGFKFPNEADDYFDLGLMRSAKVFDHLLATTNLPSDIFVVQPMQTFRNGPYASKIKNLGNIERSVIFIIEANR